MPELDYFIGKNSLVADDVKIGRGSKIWHFCNIYSCRIGEDTQIGSYTEIKQGASIGNRCRFQARVFVPENTIIGDSVFIGPGVVFLNEKYPNASRASRHDGKVEGATVKNNVVIGGNATIFPGVKVGEFAIIGAGSVVTRDVPDYAIMVGNPARKIGDIREDKYSEFRRL